MGKLTLLIILLLFYCCFSYAQCNCVDGEFSITFKDKVVFCGSLIEAKDGVLFYTEFSVKECETQKYLIDSRLDGYTNFQVAAFQDSVLITEMQLIPDSFMNNLIFLPLSFQCIESDLIGSIKISRPKFVFKPPLLNLFQRQYLDSMTEKLNNQRKLGKSPYPFDETSVYCLLLGALWNYGDCYKLYVHLGEYFEIDGAMAETIGEIRFEYIMSNR